MAADEPVWPDEVFLDLDRSGPIPLYFQVASRLEAAIRSGVIPSGARLENEIAIGERLGLSRPTIRRAIHELVEQGLLVRRRGIGTQVVHGQGVARDVKLTSLFDDLQSGQLEPSTEVIAKRVEPATELVAEKLAVDPGSDIVYFRRRRLAAGVPLALLENYLPAAFSDITPLELQHGGLYQTLRRRGLTIQIAQQRIGARAADSAEAELLGLDNNGPLLTMERVAYDSGGRAIDFGRHAYRPEMYSFETRLVAK